MFGIFEELKLNPVLPENLRAVWAIVREGLYSIAKHDKTHWIVEDVYAALVGGNASLYMAELDNDYMGFMILQRLRVYDGWHLHIWCGYSPAEKPDLMVSGMPQVKVLAHTLGCRRITFSSDRKGWERVGVKLGFVPVQTTFECEV